MLRFGILPARFSRSAKVPGNGEYIVLSFLVFSGIESSDWRQHAWLRTRESRGPFLIRSGVR